MPQPLVVLCLLLAIAPGIRAQEQDYSKVQIKSAALGANLYMLEGVGGNIVAAVGPDGALLVDDEFAGVADKIRATLKGLGAEQPVRFVVNTHYHYDHTDANLAFAQGGAVLIAHENLRTRLQRGGLAGNGGSISKEMKAAPAGALPAVTYASELTVHLNGMEIRVHHYPRAHTDGDSVVFFPGANVVHMGDIFVRYGFPFIDVLGGGNVRGMIGACADVIRTVPAGTQVVPGHGAVATLDDLREYLKMLEDTTAVVQKALTAGQTLEQMKKANILGAWSARYSPAKAFVDTDAFTEALYYSLNPPPRAVGTAH
ncbi:MAG TPA: MBL fold metallo-hydrolase [Steroidobacteraceae bacterium]|jgi:glyoxylase-like metal-dependent hydrolase (beta-lactamase superfamily II)